MFVIQNYTIWGWVVGRARVERQRGQKGRERGREGGREEKETREEERESFFLFLKYKFIYFNWRLITILYCFCHTST